MKRKRNNRGMLVFTILMVTILVVGTVANFIGNDTADPSTANTDNNNPATPRPTPLVFPTVEPEGATLTLKQPTVNSSGLFQISVPEGWDITTNSYDFNLPGARSAFLNSNRLSVVDAHLLTGVNYPSHQALSDEYFTSGYFLTAWGSYDGFTETGRTVGEAVTIDFELGLDDKVFLARQIAWMDLDWVRLVRVVVPDNNPALLEQLINLVVPTFISYNDQRRTSPTWVAFADNDANFAIRHPNWTLVSAGTVPILEAPLTDASMVLRTETETPLSSLDEAETYVQEALRPDADVLSSLVITRDYGNGYMVSFADRDNEGNPISGLAVMLNDDANNLHIAELRLTESGVDLLQPAGAEQQELFDIAQTFMVLPPEGTSVTPRENPPVIEATAEATESIASTQEATESIEAESTQEIPQSAPSSDSTAESEGN